jgi:isopenicillin N synthase-like dioxygenase
VMSTLDELTQCLKIYQELAQKIMQRVSEVLQLGGEVMEAHRTDLPSVTNMGFLKYPPQPEKNDNFGHIAHTDVGSLTILSATQRGLQVINNDTQDWIYVDPKPGQLCVQFGDCLKFLSKGRILPSIHRVVPSDVSPEATKYTVAYFIRPNEKAQIITSDGIPWLYEDYHCRKFDAFARPLGLRPKGEDNLISIRNCAAMENSVAA